MYRAGSTEDRSMLSNIGPSPTPHPSWMSLRSDEPTARFAVASGDERIEVAADSFEVVGGGTLILQDRS